jgi:adenylate cyclase
MIGAYQALSCTSFFLGNFEASREIPFALALKAEALHLADRTSESLEAISEAEALVERSEERWFCAELHRLRGVFLAAGGADDTQIEAAFRDAIRTAKQQKSISLATRAEATYGGSVSGTKRTLFGLRVSRRHS